MALKDRITTETVKVPDLMIVYGPEGVGKTTFGSKAPLPVFLDLEKGARRIKGLARDDKTNTFNGVLSFIHDLTVDPHEHKTVAIDSISELERLIWNQLCLDEGVSNVEQVGGGFNKGYTVALKYWDQIKRAVNKLQDTRNMNVILIGHSDTKTFNDPITNSSYDRHQLKCDKKAAAFLREWVDFMGFANFVTYTKGKENALKQKAYGDGTRKFYTERRPAWDAKNRLCLPLEMEFDYVAYAEASGADSVQKAQTIRENINEILKDSVDEDLKKKVAETIAKAKDNTTDLMLIQERVRTRVNKMEAENAGK